MPEENTPAVPLGSAKLLLLLPDQHGTARYGMATPLS